MPESRVIIVGGGASGLSAAGALAHRGVDAIVLEQDRELGGTWARRYDRLHLHTVRRFSGLAQFPIPPRYPTYLSRTDFVAYLNEYARHFNLRVVTGASVRNIRPLDGGSRRWNVETKGGELWSGRVAVVATGQYRQPVEPPWPGREIFAGQVTHSIAYSNAAPYIGRRVLVVGAGNSGAEIAADLSDNGAAYVALGVRTPPPIIPRDPFGMPVQRTSIVLSAWPAAIANRLGRMTARLVLGDLTRHGMPKAAIIAATGLTTGLESILDAPGVLDDNEEPRGSSGEPTPQPGLYFIGFTHPARASIRGEPRIAPPGAECRTVSDRTLMSLAGG